jgi:hypothetical protein
MKGLKRAARCIPVLILVVVVLAGLGALWVKTGKSEITRENAAKIRAGMTEGDIEELFHAAAAIKLGAGEYYQAKNVALVVSPIAFVRVWVGDDVQVIVIFAQATGRVAGFDIADPPETPERISILERARRWLGELWQKMTGCLVDWRRS